jgi:hypothetical protein
MVESSRDQEPTLGLRPGVTAETHAQTGVPAVAGARQGVERSFGLQTPAPPGMIRSVSMSLNRVMPPTASSFSERNSSLLRRDCNGDIERVVCRRVPCHRPSRAANPSPSLYNIPRHARNDLSWRRSAPCSSRMRAAAGGLLHAMSLPHRPANTPQRTELVALQDLLLQEALGDGIEVPLPLGEDVLEPGLRLVQDPLDLLINFPGRLLAIRLAAAQAGAPARRPGPPAAGSSRTPSPSGGRCPPPAAGRSARPCRPHRM